MSDFDQIRWIANRESKASTQLIHENGAHVDTNCRAMF